jgi:hypothetical protein
VAVFTKYDTFVQRFMPVDDDLCGGDIEEDIANLVDEIDLDAGSTTGAQESPIDPAILSRSDQELRNMIKPFEKMLGVPWVPVSGLLTSHLVAIAKLELIDFEKSKSWLSQHS